MNARWVSCPNRYMWLLLDEKQLKIIAAIWTDEETWPSDPEEDVGGTWVAQIPGCGQWPFATLIDAVDVAEEAARDQWYTPISEGTW